jgi:lipoprotein signal peptidase
MNHTRALVFVSVLVACVGCDHATKYAATALIDPARVISLASGALRFELAYNPGAFLGLGAGSRSGWRAARGVVPLGLPRSRGCCEPHDTIQLPAPA